MGKKFDKFEEAQNNANQARQDLAVANGGSTQAHITQANQVKWVADLHAERAWEDFIEDPEG